METNKERQKIVFNYLVKNGINEHLALKLSKELWFKSSCDIIISELKGGVKT